MKDQELKALLADMSLDEKVGQMIQITGNMFSVESLITGPNESVEMSDEMLSLVGSVLNIEGADNMNKLQKEYMEKHPHHIPLLCMYDVINGMETIFPIPLAQGATFAPEITEKIAATAAKEAAASGLHVSFAPMLDLVRDPRWGRVMESTGEDPYLNGVFGRATVRGFQGTDGKKDLKNTDNVAACFKHFAAYGLPDGGRDYDNVEISERTLFEDYLPAYREAVKEGCAMAMTSFNTLNRIPSSGNKWLLRDVLRKDMGFDGVIISDYSAVEEMVSHGIAEDCREAAKLAVNAGLDIDMLSCCYVKYLADLVRSGEVEEKLIDEAVYRILKLKNDLGLFENPFRNASAQREKDVFLCEEHKKLALEAAEDSFVLLKNDENILPLDKKSNEEIAFIGPYADSNYIFGAWSFPTKPEKTVTVKQGIEKIYKNATFTQGSFLLDIGEMAKCGEKEEYTEEELACRLEKAIENAKKAEKVVMCIGEHRAQSGECCSKAAIGLPENQMKLLREVARVNPNIITLIFTGRPLDLREITELSKSVMIVWFPGSEGGNAISNVLFGEKSPRGRLTMSIPRSVGQVPIYYNNFFTGRPNRSCRPSEPCNCYLDEWTSPLYPFGYGLSYTEFEYSPVTLSADAMDESSTLTASVKVKNTGRMKAVETVQLYLRDIAGSVVRPKKMLKGFKQVELLPGEVKQIEFSINSDMLKFYDINMDYVCEKGKFKVFIGHDSDTANEAEFRLV